jgi:6-pyruvoyl-tetrahydropterin synthase
MMLVWAKAHFAAAHRLPQHEELHGHSYEVRVYVEEGACVDALQARLRQILAPLDHTTLNAIIAVPTMENIARYVGECLPEARRITVERPLEGLGCEFVPEPDQPPKTAS